MAVAQPGAHLCPQGVMGIPLKMESQIKSCVSLTHQITQNFECLFIVFICHRFLC